MDRVVLARLRRLRRPLAAVLFGIGLLALAELTCFLFGWGEPDWSADPFVSFRATEPLFVPDGATGWLMTSPNRRRFFALERFPRRKPPGAFRIFCFGGSTVQGNPYGAATAFSTWLRLGLETAAPDRRWEVINCGGLSYASYRVANLVAECRAYAPDLFIVCTGHNEFLEARTYGRIKQAPAWLSRLVRTAAQLRLFHVLRHDWESLAHPAGTPRTESSARPVLPTEVDALLDYRGGLRAYHRDPEWRAGVLAHFEFNLRRIAGLGREAGIPLLLINPVSNLRDCPPFKSEAGPSLSPTNRVCRDALLAEVAPLLEKNPAAAAGKLVAAADLDPDYAFSFFQLGRAWEAAGRTNEAINAFLRARDLDICPLRILSPMEDALRRVAREENVPLIDWQALVAARSPGGLPGHEWLVDHVHPTPAGHRLLAEELLRRMATRDWVRLPADWTNLVTAAWDRHLAALPPDYDAQGEEALAGLRAWTRGRASGPPIEYRMLAPAPRAP